VNPAARGPVLIAGAGGMIGRYLLRSFGPRARALDRSAADDPTLAVRLRAEGIVALIDAAGAAGQPARELLQVHALRARVLAEACAAAGTTFIYLSSSRVFAGDQAEPYRETDRPDPWDDYGLSKFLGERFVQNACAASRHFILRLPMVLGLRPGAPGAQLATRLLDQARRGQPVRAARDVTAGALHAATLGPRLAAILDSELESGVYHLAGPEPASLHAILARLLGACGLEPPEAVPAAALQAGRVAHNLALAPGRAGVMEPWQAAVDRFAGEWLGAGIAVGPARRGPFAARNALAADGTILD